MKWMNDRAGNDAADPKNDSYWGGLSAMSLDINTARHAADYEDLEQWEKDFSDEFAQFLTDNVNLEAHMEHSTSNVGNVLLSDLMNDEHVEHFGTKGMKWGVRKNDDGTVTRTGRTAKGKTQLDDEKSTDFSAFTAAKAKVATSGTKALSNTELQSMVTRMNLEQQYTRLSPVKVSAGRRALNGSLKFTGEVAANTIKSVVQEQVKKGLQKGAATAATAAAKKIAKG